MSVSAARASLPRLIDAVERGDEVTLTRHGKPVAVMVRPDALRSRRADRAFEAAGEVAEQLRLARDRPLQISKGLSTQRADERAAALRADRAQR